LMVAAPSVPAASSGGHSIRWLWNFSEIVFSIRG
jgi:hypothetical protein